MTSPVAAAPGNDGALRSLLDRLGVAEDPLAGADPVSFLRSLAAASLEVGKKPTVMVRRPGPAGHRDGLGDAGQHLPRRRPGRRRSGEPGQGRQALRRSGLQREPGSTSCSSSSTSWPPRWSRSCSTARASTSRTRPRPASPREFLLDALAPTNTLRRQPRRAARGLRHRRKSLSCGVPATSPTTCATTAAGRPRSTPPGSRSASTWLRRPGRSSTAATSSSSSSTSRRPTRVHEVPLLFCPPWINKYYIMDLAPGKSLIEWAVQHGHTCFAISYRNPDASMRDLGFEDYLTQGPLDAVRVVARDHRRHEVNTLSVCLGGTLTAIAARPQRGHR